MSCAADTGLAALVDDGLVRSRLSETVITGDVRAGYDRIESGRTVGKLAVDVAAARGVESTRASNEVGFSS